ncbi:MAG: glycoside hydrolase domain-containing protein, partial [Pauljensenia sp.]
ALLLLCPADAGHLLDGLVQHYRDGGWTSRWTAPGPLDCMTGTTTDVIFADAAARGVGGFDLDDAYASAVHNATVPAPDPRVGRKGIRSQTFRGFTDTSVAEGMSWTLDSAITDAAIGRFATLLLEDLPEGDPRRDALEAEAEYFAARGARYATVFDPRTGFFLGRLPDGTWRVADPADYDPREWGFDYTETNGWGTAFTAPHDGAGLATLMGGPEALRRRLDEFFAEPETGRAEFKGSYDVTIHEMAEARDVRMGMLGLSNQPAHHIPFMYAFTGVHHRTQEVVREALRRLFLGSEIGQGYPGDEDNGEMSAWYLFAALGLYPLVPASGEFVITAPLFPATRVHLPGGDLEVSTTGEGDHVAAVWVDDEPWDRVSIPRERLVRGARIVVRLSADPTDWAEGTTPSSLTPTGARPRLRLDLTDPERARTAASSTVGPADTVFDDRGAGVLLLDEGDRVSYRFERARTTSLYTVTTDTGAAASWDLEARAGDGDWELLDRRLDEVFTWEGQTRPFRIRGARPTGHEEYRIVARSALRLVQWELLGDD